MAAFIGCPEFAQKSLEPTKDLEPSLAGSPVRSSHVGARCTKPAASSPHAWASVPLKGLAGAVMLSGFLVTGLLMTQVDAPRLAGGLPPSPQQVGAGVPSAASTHRSASLAVETPSALPALPALPAAVDDSPPNDAILSTTELRDLKECLKLDPAAGSSFAGASNGAPLTRALLRGSHAGAPGRRLAILPDCHQLIKRANKILFVLLLAITVVQAFTLVACFVCGDKVYFKYKLENDCFQVFYDNTLAQGERNRKPCPRTNNKQIARWVHCPPMTFLQKKLSCLSKNISESGREYWYKIKGDYLMQGRGMEPATRYSIPECTSTKKSNPHRFGGVDCMVLDSPKEASTFGTIATLAYNSSSTVLNKATAVFKANVPLLIYVLALHVLLQNVNLFGLSLARDP
eukprot:GHVT01090540.1.p1 GENE.GHVT01090540.1~~GHVT01090540.1.p1  ORF type:complete len:402 (+),score=38.12 GHVT01090540.1:304-1509(+)